jgi:hypothetical protein
MIYSIQTSIFSTRTARTTISWDIFWKVLQISCNMLIQDRVNSVASVQKKAKISWHIISSKMTNKHCYKQDRTRFMRTTTILLFLSVVCNRRSKIAKGVSRPVIYNNHSRSWDKVQILCRISKVVSWTTWKNHSINRLNPPISFQKLLNLRKLKIALIRYKKDRAKPKQTREWAIESKTSDRILIFIE